MSVGRQRRRRSAAAVCRVVCASLLARRRERFIRLEDAVARPEERRRPKSQVLRLVGGASPARRGEAVAPEKCEEGEWYSERGERAPWGTQDLPCVYMCRCSLLLRASESLSLSHKRARARRLRRRQKSQRTPRKTTRTNCRQSNTCSALSICWGSKVRSANEVRRVVPRSAGQAVEERFVDAGITYMSSRARSLAREDTASRSYAKRHTRYTELLLHI